VYVRWKTRPLSRRRQWDEDPGRSLSAVLVEGRRINGRPHQIYVKHLGTIPERKLDLQPWRTAFWNSVDAALDALPLSEEDRGRFQARIAERIPRPSAGAAHAQPTGTERGVR